MFDRKTICGIALTCLVVLGAMGMVEAAEAAEDELPVTYSAVAVNMGARGPRGQVRLDITVAAWSAPEVRSGLIEAMKEGERRSLSDALRGQERVGRIREVQQLGHDIQYSRSIPGADGGQQIILATDRPMGFAEVSRSTRSRDYNVTLIILNLDAEGRGEGQMMLGAQFEWDEAAKQLSITQLSSEPIRLNSIRRR
jgi:hypothetical protein